MSGAAPETSSDDTNLRELRRRAEREREDLAETLSVISAKLRPDYLWASVKRLYADHPASFLAASGVTLTAVGGRIARVRARKRFRSTRRRG